MATLEAKTKVARRKTRKPGPKAIDLAGIERELRHTGDAFLNELFPHGRPAGFEINLRSAKWRFGPVRLSVGRFNLWCHVRNVTPKEGVRQIQAWLRIRQGEPEPTLPIAQVGVTAVEERRPAVKPSSDAETVLCLYHEVAASAAGAFVLAHTTPATTKGAGNQPFHVQRFRVNDAAGMAAEARSRGERENVYFGPALMRTDLAKGKRGKEGDITAVLGIFGWRPRRDN